MKRIEVKWFNADKKVLGLLSVKVEKMCLFTSQLFRVTGLIAGRGQKVTLISRRASLQTLRGGSKPKTSFRKLISAY